jgi:predicted metal-dependent peptidase
MTEKFDLHMHTARLLLKEPFFAALSRTINKISTTDIPTAGVCINEDTAQFEMYYNPDFFEKISDEHKAGVLKHEFYHLIFSHVTGRLPPEGMSKRWNVSTDLAINSHLVGELPEGALFAGQQGTPWEHVPAGMTSEWYMSEIPWPPAKEKGPGDGRGKPGVGSHDGWREIPDSVKEIAKERLKNNLKKAVNEASKTGWGTVSSSVRKEIMSRMNTYVDWRKVLRCFIKTSQRANRSNTMRRINRRYPYIHPGRRSNHTSHIAVSIDQSGSVGDDLLNAFFNELNTLATLATFTVIPFDTKVAEAKVYEWKKGEKRKWSRVLRGGTCFNAPTEYVNQHKFDGHIVLTDMYAPKPKPSKCKRMWMTNKSGAARPYFQTNERVIAINQ